MNSKALVIDDDISSRKLVRFFCEKIGCKLTEAPDGELGSLSLLNDSQDVLILDWRMPRLTGGETMLLVDTLLKQISKNKSTPLATILYTSVPLVDLEIPDTKHFRVKGYINKKWPIEKQKKHFNKIMKVLSQEVA